MEIFKFNDYDEMSKKAADQIIDLVNKKPDAVLGLATGSTPVGMYKYLIEAKEQGRVDFSRVTTFNLDEYIGLSYDNPQSYHYFMRENLFEGAGIKEDQTHFPIIEEDGSVERGKYEKEIEEKGGIDIQVLGIGQNGHIAFNEPADQLNAYTSVIELTESTIEANSRFFESKDQVPTKAASMGMATIMSAKKLIVLANGVKKKEPVKMLLKGDKITSQCPVTFTLLHRDCKAYFDREAL